MTRLPSLLLSAALLALGGCDMLGIESTQDLAARREADGKAIGGACRHAGRAIEDCYTLNRKSDRAAIFAGWREMDDYMRSNKLEIVAPSLGQEPQVAARAPEDVDAKKPAKPAAADKSRKHDS